MSVPNVVSETSICNMALARIGSTQSITSLADRSNEARQCAIWYPQDRDVLLCDFPFPWSESYFNLDQVAGPEINGQVANAQWSRTYRYPSDCLKVRRLVATPQPLTATIPQTTAPTSNAAWGNQPWKRAVGNPYPISYAVGHDATGRLIMTDSVGTGFGVTCVYTAAVEDPTQFSADFVDALAWRLAADLAMGLAFSDAKRNWAHQEYEKHARTVRATTMNEQQSDIPLIRTQSEMINARWRY
jgi:hypothetical protein